MAHERAPGSLIDGLVLLSLLWWSWSAFSWLANQARADEGVLQAAVIDAMLGLLVALCAPLALLPPLPAIGVVALVMLVSAGLETRPAATAAER